MSHVRKEAYYVVMCLRVKCAMLVAVQKLQNNFRTITSKRVLVIPKLSKTMHHDL